MWIFKDSDDLIREVERLGKVANMKSEDKSLFKREQLYERSRATAFFEVLDLLRDYFRARQDEPGENMNPSSSVTNQPSED